MTTTSLVRSSGAVACAMAALLSAFLCASGCKRAATTPATISVVTMWPGASASEIDARVTSVIEDAVKHVDHVAHVDAISSTGASTVVATLAGDVDAHATSDDVRAKLAGAQAKLPKTSSSPIVDFVEAGSEPVLRIALKSGGAPLAEATAILDKFVRPPLDHVDGVARITVDGGAWREVDVDVDPARLTALGLSIVDVADAMAHAHVRRLDDVRNLVLRVAADTQAPVTMRDVATVSEGARRNGTASQLALVVWRRGDASSVDVRAAVRARIERAPLPAGYDVDGDDTAIGDVDVIVTGVDAAALTSVAHEIASHDVAFDAAVADASVHSVAVDDKRAADLGVDATEAARAIQFANGGAPVTQLEGPHDVDVRVRLVHDGNALGDVVRVRARDHSLVPLTAIVAERDAVVPAVIDRRDGVPALHLCARIHGDLEAAAKHVRALVSTTKLPAGARVVVDSGPALPVSACAAIRSVASVSQPVSPPASKRIER